MVYEAFEIRVFKEMFQILPDAIVWAENEEGIAGLVDFNGFPILVFFIMLLHFTSVLENFGV